MDQGNISVNAIGGEKKDALPGYSPSLSLCYGRLTHRHCNASASVDEHPGRCAIFSKDSKSW
jgi:hypothetical protein